MGQLILLLLNNYGAGVAVFFYAVLEVIGVMWIYGNELFLNHINCIFHAVMRYVYLSKIILRKC